MATSLDAKIEFKQLCDVLENVAKAREAKRKVQILQTFIDSCRNIGKKMGAESVCNYVIILNICCIMKKNLRLSYKNLFVEK